jgi:hypothetical protein
VSDKVAARREEKAKAAKPKCCSLKETYSAAVLESFAVGKKKKRKEEKTKGREEG